MALQGPRAHNPRMDRRGAERIIARAVFRKVREMGFSDAHFARSLGRDVDPRAVNNWKKRGRIPGNRKFAVATFFQVPAEALAHTAVRDEASFVIASPANAGNVVGGPSVNRVPIFEWHQIGGTMPAQTAEKRIATSAKVGRRAFALTVRDDLMEPEFTPGATIIVDPEVRPESGKYVVVQADGHAAIFRQLVVDGGSTYLKPLNPRYPISIMPKGAVVLGVVVSQEKHY